jgi:hypothetical protein
MTSLLIIYLVGAISLSAQQTLGSLLPVFVFQYAGLDPHLLTSGGGIPTIPTGGSIPSGVIPSGVIPTGAIPSGVTIPTGAPRMMFARAVDPNPLASLSHIPNAPSLQSMNMLSSLPVLIVGLSNYVLVPASIIFGRRPVILFCGILATACCVWAGKSQSLHSHLAARCIQALGAGSWKV